MNMWEKFKNYVTFSVIKLVLSVLVPLCSLPLALSHHPEARCAYVILVVAWLWFLEAVPISATALLPVVLFPILGVLTSDKVCASYMKESFMMFIGGLIVAIAVEHCHLHERIALKIMLFVGTQLKWLMMGFMLTTMFLSMWVSNTATTAMMVPIVTAMVDEIAKKQDLPSNDIQMTNLAMSSSESPRSSELVSSEESSSQKDSTNLLKKALLLSICYSANIGGTGTLTGTPPNLVLKSYLDEHFKDSDEITFTSWMIYNIPGMLLCVLIAWLYLYLVHIKCGKVNFGSSRNDSIREIISKKYKDLGPITLHEGTVIVLFLLLVALWIFRDPKFIPGWADVIGTSKIIKDSVPAIGISFLFFCLPSDSRHLSDGPRVLDWKTVEKKLPWGVIILVGGGLALAEGAKESKLSIYIGKKLSGLYSLPPAALVSVLCIMTAMITEIMTNTTTATILMPIVDEMAKSLKLNPLYLLLPVTVTCSYAFMLPVATPPNAIAFDGGQMKMSDMAKPGIVMNLVCCCVQIFTIHTLGVALFSVSAYPSWANNTSPASVFAFENFLNISNSSSVEL